MVSGNCGRRLLLFRSFHYYNKCGSNIPSFTWQGAQDTHSDVEGYYYYPYFNWNDGFDAHSGIHGYYVYWGTNPNGTREHFSVASNFDPPPVQTGTYYLRIQTVDNLGNSAPWSTIYMFKYNATLNLVVDPPLDDPQEEEPEEEEPDNPDVTLDAINIIDLLYVVNFLIIIGCAAIITSLTLKNVLTKRKL